MPIYEYRRRSDGSIFEIHQSIHDDPLTICPTTGSEVDRIISLSAFHLKGTGWYTTDYKGSKASPKTTTEEAPSSSDATKPACQGGPASCGANACKTNTESA